MSELLDAAVSPANIIITALAVFILIYWLTVIFGLLDLDFFDFDVDIDADAEVDGVSVTWLNSALAFFNLGQIPFMIFMTFLIIPAWAIAILVNHTLGISSFLMGSFVLIGVLFLSLFIAKILTTPFIKVFGKLNSANSQDKVLIGKICTVTIMAKANKTGQATVDSGGAPYLLNVITPDGIEMEKGDSGLVLEYLEDKNVYLIEPYNS